MIYLAKGMEVIGGLIAVFVLPFVFGAAIEPPNYNDDKIFWLHWKIGMTLILTLAGGLLLICGVVWLIGWLVS